MEQEKKKPKESGDSGAGLGSPFDEPKPPGMATVSVGPYVERLPVAGRTVGEVRKKFKQRMDIDDRSQAILDGQEVSPDTRIDEGQTLMFIHKSGEKGAPNKPTPMELTLANPNESKEGRYNLLKGLLEDDSPAAKKIVANILSTLEAKMAPAVESRQAEVLAKMIKALEEGPMRVATFVEMQPGGNKARVIMDDGTVAYSSVPVFTMVGELRCGDEVLLDKGMNAILYRFTVAEESGETARFERMVGLRHAEVTMHQDRYVFKVAADLADQIKKLEVEPGATLVVSDKKKIAYRAIPDADSLAHYRYLVREPVPNIMVDRDIGSPPQCISECVEHIYQEMTDPGTGREYGIKRTQMRLFAGVSGSGKTLALQAICAGAYDVMSEVTGVPVKELPPRTFRLRMAEVLNCLLGESDKNLARFFKEVEQMADEPFVYKGRKHELPVIAVIEEVDGLARSRGMDHDGVYDRILTTALQWLDSTRPELDNKLILYIGTTNEPNTIDRAFLRRIGGQVDTFGRLNREGFTSVLDKHLGKVPITDHRKAAIQEIVEWIFSAPPCVELTFNTGKTAQRHRKDMLTGALVDRAVQYAAKVARRSQVKSQGKKGIGIPLLLEGFENQFSSMIGQLTEQNARNYVDIPDGLRVATVKRIKAEEKTTQVATT